MQSEEVPDEYNDIEALGTEPASGWISKQLPIPQFSTTFPNNRSMELEARALYKLFVLVQVFKPNYSDKFFELLDNYDFSLLRAKKEADYLEYETFSDLLMYATSNVKLMGKCVLSACNMVFKNTDRSKLCIVAFHSGVFKIGKS